MTSVTGHGVPLAGRYRLDELVASGAAGQVWRAFDLLLERHVAAKLLRPDAAGDPEARARFRAEASNASRLSHPGVAQVYDYGQDGSPHLPFLVMELVDGPSLAEVLAAGPLDPGQTMDLIAQVGGGLHAAHSAGLVHRDIKPANLLITGDGWVKITDFGIASTAWGVRSTATGDLLGTPAYLAPERAAGRVATPASDLYSLGVVGYECLTGAPPFRGPALQVAEAHLRHPFPALPETVPAAVAALVAALTAKDPQCRPGSAREVAERAGKLRTAGDLRAVGKRRKAGRLGAAGDRGTADTITRPEANSPAAATGGPPAACLTLPGVGAQAALAGEAAFGGHHPRSAWKRIGAGLAVAAAMTVAGLAGWHAGLTGAATPRSAAARQPAPKSPPMVLVSSASLAGEQSDVVVADLRRLGVRPRPAWVATQAQPPGTVLSVQPGGELPPGTVVTVAVAARPTLLGGQMGDGGDGNGGHGGDGGGNGGDGGGNGD